MPCSICPSFSLRCASLVQLQYLLVKIFLYLVFLEYCTLALQSGISEEYLLLLSSLFNFGPGFKNSKLLLFFFLFFFPSLAVSFSLPRYSQREGGRQRFSFVLDFKLDQRLVLQKSYASLPKAILRFCYASLPRLPT